MSEVTIYHNPRCSKSRQTLQLLHDNGVEPEIVEYLKVPPSRDELMRILGMLGISAAELVRSKEAAFKELGLSTGSAEQELIDAMPLIRGRVPDAQLVVVGGGDDARRLRMRAAASGSGNSVLFVGEVSDAHLHDLYEKCAIFAMPSRGEGFGLVYLEAMAHGKPCVGSIHDAAGEVIAHGETGLLVDPNDVDGMAEAISGLLLDKELRHGMGKLARDRQRQHFSFEQFASAFSGVVCEAFQ